MKTATIFEVDAQPPKPSMRKKLARFWMLITTPAAPSRDGARARLAKAGPFYTDAQKAALYNPEGSETCGSLKSK